MSEIVDKSVDTVDKRLFASHNMALFHRFFDKLFKLINVICNDF